MGVGLLAKYRQTLLEVAEIFNRAAISLPVSTRHLCKRLNVTVKRENIPRLQAYLRFDDIRATRATVVLPEMVGNGNYERFLIAHELGHLILKREHGAIPSGTSEYWKHETLCDEFARALLLPEGVVKNLLEQTPNNAVGLLDLSERLMTQASVYWLGSARRVADLNGGVTFLRLERKERGQYQVVATSREGHKGVMRSPIRGDLFLKALGRALHSAGREPGEPSNDIGALDSTSLQRSGIPAVSTAREGAIARARYGDLHLVVLH